VVVMENLGLSDFDLSIRSQFAAFRYDMTFRLLYTNRLYTVTGTAPSPSQCFDAAMVYLAQVVRETVAG
jgi:hypothetical protein